MIYKKYYFENAILEERYKKRMDENGQIMDKEVPIKGDTGLYYVVVFDNKLNKPNVYFRPDSFDAHEFLSIWKSTYMLYNDKKEVVTRYESYGYSPNIGDLEVFYNPFLFVKMLKESHCDSYEEKKNKYQQMIKQAIITHSAM